MEKKKILMLGGTGAMGMYLAPEMIKLGYQIYITSRKEHESTEDMIYLTGNAKDMGFMKTLLQEKFDCIVDFMIYSTEEFQERYLQLRDDISSVAFWYQDSICKNFPQLPTFEAP